LSYPPEGERPGGEDSFEQEEVSPQDPDPGAGPGPPEEAQGDLPDLEPEFVEALRSAEDGGAEDDQPAEEDEPAVGGAAAKPSSEQPTEERPIEAPHTVEFTAEEKAEAAGEGDEEEQEVSDGKPRRTVVIGAGPEAPPAPDSPAVPSPSAPVTGIPEKLPPEGDFEPAPKRKRLWARFALGSFFIVASVAASVAASVLLEVKGIAEALQPIPKVKRLLQKVDGGEPQNFLVLGSDKRASLAGTRGLSDTTILLRLDPDNNAIALMSIPRDLKTYIPGVGVTKFNAAYAYGGPKLALRVVKRITGLPINHVVNVDFLGFVRAINAVECVYVDVDRRYYHSNAGLPASQQYAEINIQPGYQKLCGKDALQYVRYRHTDTDLVRSARQQDFLREARQRVPVSDLVLPGERDELIEIFTRHTSSDISGLETMLDVLDLLIASRSAPIKEIHFPAVLHPSYVTASQASINQAVDKFLGIEASGGPRGSLDLPAGSGDTGIVPEERKRAREASDAAPEPKAPPTPSLGEDGLVDASQFGRSIANKVARKTLRSFPVFYPRRLPSGSIYVQLPRVYHFTDPDRDPHGAYKMVLQLPQGDYFGIQGVHDWSDPPILSNPSETRKIRGRDYDIYLDGDRVRLISWHEGDNSYWVNNSLLQTLTNDQMLGIARSIGKVPGERTRGKQKQRGKQ
jgi:polyisoprenyl-teichoic acid--peptidoglycan teichoic acid transferase